MTIASPRSVSIVRSRGFGHAGGDELFRGQRRPGLWQTLQIVHVLNLMRELMFVFLWQKPRNRRWKSCRFPESSLRPSVILGRRGEFTTPRAPASARGDHWRETIHSPLHRRDHPRPVDSYESCERSLEIELVEVVIHREAPDAIRIFIISAKNRVPDLPADHRAS